MEIPLWGDIVIIFEQDEQNFDTIGLGMLVPNSGEVYEELNGDFTLTFQHPYDTGGKWKRIEMGRIVLAETPRGKQPFRIYYHKPTMDGIEVQARHIFYDLMDNICESVAYSGSAQGAMDAIKEGLSVPMPFTFYTDISCDTGGIGCTMDNPVSLLLREEWDDREGETKSFFNFYGGELKRDFFNVSMLESLGNDRGVCIAYRKNLVGLEVTEDISDVATRIYPIGKDGLALDGQYIDSPYIGNYAYPKIKVIEDTNAETQSDLQKIAEDYFANGGDVPKVNIKVDFTDLSQTAEYKQYSNLERVFLGDTVTVFNQKMGFSKKAKVISYKFDPLLKRYEEMELGDFSPTVTSPITKGANAGEVANTAYGKSNNAETLLQQHLKDFNNPHRVTAEQVGGGSGSKVLHGPELPSNDLGSNGDYYIKEEVQGVADENTLLLLHCEDFVDSSIYRRKIVNTGCTISNNGKFQKGIDFSGLNKVETAEEIFNPNSVFTIDFWCNQRQKKNYATFIGGISSGTFKIILIDGEISFQTHGDSAEYKTGFSPSVGKWFHVALIGNNGEFTFFINGKKKNTFTISKNITNSILRIGLNVNQNDVGSVEGVMDEIRISNIIRWTSDFELPTKPYTVYQSEEQGEMYVKESGRWKKILTGGK